MFHLANTQRELSLAISEAKLIDRGEETKSLT